MKKYEVRIVSKAEKQMAKFPKEAQKRIWNAMLALAGNPYPPDCELLKKVPGFWRIKVGDYRIVYTINETEVIVLVVRVAHRKDIYRSIMRLKRF